MDWRLRGFETALNLLVDRGLQRCDPGAKGRERPGRLTQRLVPAIRRGLDPTGLLDRGFVLVTDASGLPVTSAQALPAGAAVDLRWKHGNRGAVLG